MATKDRISVLTEQDKTNLLNKSAKVLPSNPSDKGFSAAQILAALYEPSLLNFKHLSTLITQTRSALDDIDTALSGKVDKVEGKELIPTSDLADLALNTSARHSHENKTLLDNTTAIYTAEEKTKLNGLSNTVIADDLTTNDSSKALSAKQGKVLNERINIATSGIMHYRGSVTTIEDLPEDANVGDVYNVTFTGENCAWDGENWDSFGSSVDLSNYVENDDLVTILGYRELDNGESVSAGDIRIINNFLYKAINDVDEFDGNTENFNFVTIQDLIENEIQKWQTTTVIVRDATTNINGRVFVHFTATLITAGYTFYQIKKDGAVVTRDEAAEYMHYMTGSYYVPTYNYDFPRQVIFMFADGSTWKPQFDSEYGLLLYKLSDAPVLTSGAQTITGQKTFADDQLVCGSIKSNDSQVLLKWSNGNIAVEANSGGIFGIAGTALIDRNNTGQMDLGSSSHQWKDLYLSGALKNNNATYGLTLPDTTSFTANKEIATKDDIQNVREVAEGKCRTFVLSYQDTAPTEETFVENKYKKPDGTYLNTWQDFLDYITIGLNVRGFGNSIFNSQNDVLVSTGKYFITKDYIVLLGDPHETENVGDIILVIETEVPDRWCDLGDFYKLETSKIDLTSYPTFTNLNSILGGIVCGVYDSSQTYALDDIVIYDNKLYKCTTTIATAESWDSTHWTQTQIRDYFVDKIHAQTITGVKTFSNGIGFGGGTNIEKDSSDRIVLKYNNDDRLKIGNANLISKARIDPDSNNTYDLGRDSLCWKDGYFSGQVYAQNTFNVINATDIVNNTLTQAQYDLITNGKPTLISGTFLNLLNPFIVPFRTNIGGGTVSRALYFCYNASGNARVGVIQINNGTLVMSIYTGNTIDLESVDNFNGKSIPAYPSNTGTFVLKCVDGVLTWVAE